MRKLARFNPSKLIGLENTVSVFKYGSTIRSTLAFNTRIHDFIIVIDEGLEKAVRWHQKMMSDYPWHYSKIYLLGSRYISKIQRYSKLCPMIYNSCIMTDENKLIKYGVVSKDDLVNSLTNWESPFIINRFKKMIYQVGNLDTYLQTLILQNDLQTIRLSLLGLCKDTLSDQISQHYSLKEPSNNFHDQANEVSLLEFLREIVNSSYKGDIRFLFNNSIENLCEEELHNSLPFLTARYLPLIIDYFQNNKSEFKMEGVDLDTLDKMCSLAKSINDRMALKLMKNPMSGMSNEFCTNEDWNLFFKLFFNEKVTLKINASNEWRANEFFKLPKEFKNRASRIAARKRLLRLLPINILSNQYINSMLSSAYLPWSSRVIDETIRMYNFRCSLVGILNNILSNFGKIVSEQTLKPLVS